MKKILIIITISCFWTSAAITQCTVTDPITFVTHNVGDLGLTAFDLELDKPNCNTATITVKYIVGRSTMTMPATASNVCPSTPFGATYLQAEFLLGIPPVFDGAAGTPSISASNGMSYFSTPMFQNNSDWQVNLIGDIPPGVELTFIVANMPVLSTNYTNQMIPMNLNLKAGIPDNNDPNDDMAIAVDNVLDNRLIVDAQSDCDPVSAGLIAIDESGTATSWSWTGPGLPSGSTVQNPSVPAEPASSGTYTVTATADNGCQFTDMIDLDVMNCASLPVELITFKATPQDCQMILEWVTASETNNNYFELEHSSNGKTFKTIATVKGAGNSLDAKTYHYIHDAATVGENYYRLKQVDFDGSFAHSKVIVEEANCGKEDAFTIFPTVLDNSTALIVDFHSSTASPEFTINNAMGQPVLKVNVDQSEGESGQIRINTSSLSSGTYYILSNRGDYRLFTVVE